MSRLDGLQYGGGLHVAGEHCRVRFGAGARARRRVNRKAGRVQARTRARGHAHTTGSSSAVSRSTAPASLAAKKSVAWRARARGASRQAPRTPGRLGRVATRRPCGPAAARRAPPRRAAGLRAGAGERTSTRQMSNAASPRNRRLAEGASLAAVTARAGLPIVSAAASLRRTRAPRAAGRAKRPRRGEAPAGRPCLHTRRRPTAPPAQPARRRPAASRAAQAAPAHSPAARQRRRDAAHPRRCGVPKRCTPKTGLADVALCATPQRRRATPQSSRPRPPLHAAAAAQAAQVPRAAYAPAAPSESLGDCKSWAHA